MMIWSPGLDAVSAALIVKYAALVALQLVAEPWPSLQSTTRFAAAAGIAASATIDMAHTALRTKNFLISTLLDVSTDFRVTFAFLQATKKARSAL
jgi:hypothetical protein